MQRLNLKSPHFFQVISLIAIAMIGFGFRIIILLRVLVFYSGQNLLIFSFLFSLIAFSGFLFHPIVGFLADRSRRQTFLIAIVCYGTSPLMLIFSNNIPLVCFLGIIEGIGDAAHSSSLQMSYFDLSSSSRKASTRSAWYLSLVSTLSSTGAAFFLALFSASSQDIQFYLSFFLVFYLVYVFFGITIPETVQNEPKLSPKLLSSIKSSLKGVITSITGIKDMNDVQRSLILQYVLFMFVFGMADSFVSCVSVAIFYNRLSFSNMALTYGILGLATLLGSFIVYYRENKNLVLTTLQLT
ncbi:MAG: MFS transporter, partial [Promethearchaeota archaeon]